jgi:hypothetical protein
MTSDRARTPSRARASDTHTNTRVHTHTRRLLTLGLPLQGDIGEIQPGVMLYFVSYIVLVSYVLTSVVVAGT